MDRREALAADLRALADDLRSLVESATTDPKERQRKERYWSALVGVLGVATTLAGRKLAVKLWGVLTGEEAPLRRPPGPEPHGTPRPERAPDDEARSEPSQAETISSPSSSVK